MRLVAWLVAAACQPRRQVSGPARRPERRSGPCGVCGACIWAAGRRGSPGCCCQTRAAPPRSLSSTPFPAPPRRAPPRHATPRRAAPPPAAPAAQEGDFVVMVQEYAGGGDLFRLLQKYGGRLSERQAVAMVLDPFLRALQVGLGGWGGGGEKGRAEGGAPGGVGCVVGGRGVGGRGALQVGAFGVVGATWRGWRQVAAAWQQLRRRAGACRAIARRPGGAASPDAPRARLAAPPAVPAFKGHRAPRHQAGCVGW